MLLNWIQSILKVKNKEEKKILVRETEYLGKEIICRVKVQTNMGPYIPIRKYEMQGGGGKRCDQVFKNQHQGRQVGAKVFGRI